MIIRVTERPVTVEHITIDPIRLRVSSRPLRVLDFDVEARPLHWIASDYVSKEITAMAWKFIGEPTPTQCYLLGEVEPREMLSRFLEAYNAADLVTGHFIRGYDLPTILGALMEYQMPALDDKMTHDTKLDLVRRSGISVSQENIGAMLHLEHKKVHMDQAKWRAANRLTASGRKLARERVVGDVEMHIEMRARLLRLGYLSEPKLWKSGSAKVEEYTP